MLLEEKGVEYEDVRVDDDRSLREEMTRLSRRHTVPQIWIGDAHVGGYNELSVLERSGELDTLLGIE